MKAKFFLMLIVAGSLFTSCLKPEKFPIIPFIEFDSFSALSDSGILVISFTDGDGNIGLAEGDTTGSYSTNLKYHHNLFVEYFEKVDGLGWQPGKNFAGDDIVFLYRIPVLTPKGKNKALKGTISTTIEPSYYNPLSSDSDTIKYRITLVDRDLNESNVIESSEIYR